MIKFDQRIEDHVCRVFQLLNSNKLLLNAYLNMHLKINIQECCIFLRILLRHVQLIQDIDQFYRRIIRWLNYQ